MESFCISSTGKLYMEKGGAVRQSGLRDVVGYRIICVTYLDVQAYGDLHTQPHFWLDLGQC